MRLSVCRRLWQCLTRAPDDQTRLVKSLEAVPITFELVFVNDGSSDSTPALLEDLQVGDDRVVAVHLSRNFGHQAAVQAASWAAFVSWIAYSTITRPVSNLSAANAPCACATCIWNSS